MKRRIIAALIIAIVFAGTVTTGVLSAMSTEINAIYKEPRIEIVVPSTGQMILNPESLPMRVNGKIQSAQIINTPWCIENHSEVGVKVDAVVSAEIADGSTIELSTRSLIGTWRKEKLVFMYLDMQVTDPGVDLEEDLDWPSATYNIRKHMLVTKERNERANIMTLAPAHLDGTLSEGGIGAFHLEGNATPNPTDAWDVEKDKINVKVTFTFRPTCYLAA